MSDIFRELEEVTVEQYEHQDLPKWLADPVLLVARSPELYQGKEYLVEILVVQVREYDVYAEAGCCKWAYDHECVFRMNPTAIPAGCQPPFRSDADRYSVRNPTAVPEQSDRLFVM